MSRQKTVSTSDYHKYLPAETPLHVDPSYWNGVGIDVFNFPLINDGIPAPAIEDYTLTYVSKVPMDKIYYGYNEGKWIPFRPRPGLLQLINKDTSVKWQWRFENAPEHPVSIAAHISSRKLKSIALRTLDKNISEIEMLSSMDVNDSLANELIKVLASEARNDTIPGKLYGETAAQLLCMQVLRHHCSFRYRIPEYDFGLSKTQLAGVFEFIDANLDSDISLTELSRVCGLSDYHFIRFFKRRVGVPPHQYVIKRRMEKAEALLRQTSLSVLAIASKVGYESQSHFTLLFKRYFGVSPRRYRQKIQS